MVKVVVIHGFGPVDMDKSFFQSYIPAVERIIEENDVDLVVCTGGYTVSKEISEAASMRDTLTMRGSEKEFLLEEQASTTFGNVKYVSKLLQSHFQSTGTQLEKLTIVTSNAHLYKTIYLSLLMYSSLVGEEKTEKDVIRLLQNYFKEYSAEGRFDGKLYFELGGIDFHGVDIPWQTEQPWKQILAAITETAYMRHPDIHEEYVERRKKQWRK